MEIAMKNMILIVLLLVICILSSSCLDSSGISNSSSIDDSTTDGRDIKSFNLSVSMNLKEVVDDGKIGSPIGFRYAVKDESVSVALESLTVVDGSMNKRAIPIKVWLICDNSFLPFSLDDGEYKETNMYEENQGNVHIITFKGERKMRFITVIISAFTNDKPDLKLGLYSGVCSYTFVNTASNTLDNVPSGLSSDNYYSNPDMKKEGCFNIDYSSIKMDPNNHVQFSNDYVLNKNENLFVKYNYDAVDDKNEPIGVYYSMFIICDGEIVSAFDNKKAFIVKTEFKSSNTSSDKLFQFELSSKYYNTEGLHIIQAVVVPYYIPDALNRVSDTMAYGFDGYSTNKTRVVVK